MTHDGDELMRRLRAEHEDFLEKLSETLDLEAGLEAALAQAATFDHRESEGAVIIRAIVQGECVGVIHVAPREFTYGRSSVHRYAEVTLLQVADRFRRRGIGGVLLHRGLEWARRQGFEKVSVEASARAGTPGRAFYEAKGFVARSVVLDVDLTEGDVDDGA